MYNVDWDLLAKMANLAQLTTFMMEVEDVSNSVLSEKLDNQNNNYLEIILSNQKVIMERLSALEVKLDGK